MRGMLGPLVTCLLMIATTMTAISCVAIVLDLFKNLNPCACDFLKLKWEPQLRTISTLVADQSLLSSSELSISVLRNISYDAYESRAIDSITFYSKSSCRPKIVFDRSEYVIESDNRTSETMIVEDLGITKSRWTQPLGKVCRPHHEYSLRYLLDRRKNFHKAVLRTATSSGEIVEGIPSETGIMQGSRAAESTVRDMQMMTNFRVSHRALTQEEADYRKPGYFELGVGKLLNDSQADIAIGYYLSTTNRFQLASPLLPIMSEGAYAYYIRPKPILTNIYLRPFSLSALGGCAIIIILVSVVIVLSLSSAPTTSSAIKMVEVNFVAIRLISRQSMFANEVQSSSFVLNWGLVVGGLFSLMLWTLYGAHLILVLKAPQKKSNGIDDLYRWGYNFYATPAVEEVLFHGKSHYLISHSNTEAVIQDMFKSTLSYVTAPLNSINSGPLSTVMKKYLTWTENPDAYLCTMFHSVKVNANNNAFTNAFFVKKHSQFRGVLNWSILKIREAGHLKRSMKVTGDDRLECPRPQAYAENLDMSEVSSAFILLFTVSISSLLIVCIEHVWTLRNKWAGR